MRARRLFYIGIVLGMIAMPVMGATFSPAPGDAVAVSDNVTVQAPDGPTVTVAGSTDLVMEQMFPDADTVLINSSVGGNVSVHADGSASATVAVDSIEGTWTNVTGVTTTGTWLVVRPADKQQVSVRGDTQAIRVRDMALSDGTTDFQVTGPPGGTARVRVSGLPATTEVQAVNQSGTVLDTNTTDASGQVQFSINTSTHTVSLKSSSPAAVVPATGQGSDSSTSLWQHVTLFLLAVWWSRLWLLQQPGARWRYATTCLVGAILWIAVAFTALGAGQAHGGTVTAFSSAPIAFFGAFMAAVSVLGAMLGLLLWARETVRVTAGRPAVGDDD